MAGSSRGQAGNRHCDCTLVNGDSERYYFYNRQSVIDTDEKLAAYLPVVRAADWIAVDTEADSLHAYPEKVCLIQISTQARATGWSTRWRGWT